MKKINKRTVKTIQADKNEKVLKSDENSAKKANNNAKLKQNKKIEQKISRNNDYRMGSKAKGIIIVLSVALALILVASGIAFYSNTRNMNNYARVLEGVYSSAYFNMVDKVNSISTSTDKLLLAEDKQSKVENLRNISKDCDAVVASLSVLSVDSENVTEMTKFFNQLGGFTDALLTKVMEGKDVTNKDIEIISDAAKSISKMKTSLNDHNETLAHGDYKFVVSSEMKNGKSEFSRSLGNMTSDSMEYPAMIFDGPFSEALQTRQINGLSTTECTKDEARDYVLNTLFKDQKAKIRSEAETDGKFYTYDFTVDIDEIDYFVQITKKGKFLLTMSGYNLEAVDKISEKEALELAQKFAEKAGIKNFKYVWNETVNNVSYINFAAVQNDVILYPDLIKIKVDLSAGKVIGWEAQNYAYNHTKRNLKFELMEEEILGKVSADIKVNEVNMAIIPTEAEIEICCYEIIGEKIDGKYYVYISAEDGNIVKILKEINTKKAHKLI